MEMLIEDFDDESKSKYKDNDGMYLDVCEWLGVRCDADGRVVQILINSKNVTGSLELRYVPPKVKVLFPICLVASRLTGSADLTQLPEGMQNLSLSKNRFTGEIDLTQLPEGMYMMYLNNNQLTGEIDLTQLPEGMYSMYLNNNQLTGEIDLAHLPCRMTYPGVLRLFWPRPQKWTPWGRETPWLVQLTHIFFTTQMFQKIVFSIRKNYFSSQRATR